MPVNRKSLLRTSIIVCLVLGIFEGACYSIASRVLKGYNGKANVRTPSLQLLREENILLRKRIKSLEPDGIYIVVDTANNVLYLKKGERTVLQAIVSCGSGNILVDSKGKRKWVFDTPKGEFVIRSKFTNPTWIKPDWAFIEEGKSAPDRFEERIEGGVLGEYALGFGNGYFIHGTLYTRLLGKNITHGCIRVGDKELRIIYQTVPIGTRVMIF